MSRFLRSSILALLLFLFQASTIHGERDESRMLVRIHLPTPQQWQALKKAGVEARFGEGKKWVDLILTPDEVTQLNQRGFETSVLLTEGQLKSLKLCFDPAYHTYEEMENQLKSLKSDYPDIARLDSIGVSTQGKKIIWAFKISDKADLEEDEPAVLYNGVHHGCEVIGLEICMRLIRDLLTGYGSDPWITYWIDHTEIWFVPLLNPDGHSAVTSELNLYWRKNARDLDRDGLSLEYLCNDWWTCYTEGVDLNRNYDFNWEYGGSYQSWHYNYRGEYPFSELETQALRELALAQRFTLSISYHSYGEVVFYPWMWGSGYAPDEPTLGDIAFNIASRITKQSGEEPYDYGHSGALAGMSTNWLYGKLGTFDYMVEVLCFPFFVPPGHQVESIYLKNKPGALYLLQRVHGPSLTGTITDSVTNLPLEAVVRVLEIAERFTPPMDERTSEPLYGRYRWLVLPGIYTLEVSKQGYYTQTISNIVVAQDQPSAQDVSLVRVLRGDPSLDRAVDAKDIVFLVNYLFQSGTAPDPLWVGDSNCSQEVDISDIIYLINYVLKSGPKPCAGQLADSY